MLGNGNALRRYWTYSTNEQRSRGIRTPRKCYSAPSFCNALINLSCAKPGRFRCEVVGVDGKTVKVLADRSFPSGTHTVAWNGDNESGAQVAAGVYMLRVREKDRVSTMRIISVR